MTHDLILKGFQATGVWPIDADPVLQRFNNGPQQQDNEPGVREQGEGLYDLNCARFLTLRWLTRLDLSQTAIPRPTLAAG
ncbi:hypothetical protein IG631_24173 [Alternaria alternata]|nr:hypothetical protein IG631_24173 [Alternaria alternata]